MRFLFLLITFAGSAVCSEKTTSLEKLLTQPIETIVDRDFDIPEVDPHDYVSLAIYWWPNPYTQIPYIRKDGKRNPAKLLALFPYLNDDFDFLLPVARF